MSEWMKKLSLRQRMKGSSRSTMKEDSASAAKPRIGTRSTGRLNLSSSRSPRTVRSATSSPRTPQVARTSRSISPGSPLLNLRTKRARLEKGKETQKTSKPVDTTPKHEEVPSTETSQSGSQNSQSSEGSQSSQNTPKGAGIRTRLSTGSIHMNGTMTVSAAKEKAELDLIMKQISKTDNTSTTKNPASVGKKRTAVPVVVSQDSVLTSDHPPPKKRKIGRNDGSGEDNCNDYFCWLCHKEGTLVCCELCPRVYHTRCLGLSAALPQDWVCPECEKIMRAECVDTRSKAMEMLTIDQLCVLLKYALERMKHAGSEPFQKPVDLNAVPNYFDYIFHPMDLSTLEKNIKKKLYGCTEALLADAKWILHNCIIYNGAHSKLTSSAKMIIKICKHEMNEIELCPDCYLNSCVRKNDDWFSETCRVPHTLVWAKLKGYPFWPSKALREIDGQVDVRFFGAHDRSWVPVSQCFLLSKNIPTSLQRGKKNSGLDMAIEELNLHVKKLRERFGGFEYAPFRTPYDKTDSYKPISQKPELSSNTASIPKSNQTREMKSGNNSSLTSLKPNILRKSAVAKIRNKYSAMVSLKKIDMSPDKTKRKTPLEEDAEKAKSEENYGDLSDKKPESVTFEISKEPNSNEVEKNETAGVSGEIKQVDDQTKGKIIKKSFVSSNLIERIESKLKALEDEPEKELMSVESVVSVSDTNILAVNVSDTAALHEKEPLVQSIEKSTVKEIEKEIDKTEKEISELKSAENLLKDNSLGQLSEVGEEVTTTPEEQINQNSEEKLKEAENMQISQDKFAENKEPDKSHESVSGHEKDSKTLNRLKLDTLIKSCKEKLGMDNEEAAEIDSALSDDVEDVGSSEEEEDESGNEDASESEDEDNSEGSKEVEDTGTESGSVSTEKDDKSEEENSKLHSSCEGNNDGKGKYETSEEDKCVTVSESTTNSGAVSERNENEVKSSILTSKSTIVTDSKTAEHNQNKLIDMKSTAMNVKKSDEVAFATVNSDETQHSERITKDVKQTLNEKKTQSVMSDVSTNSSDGHLNAVVQAECRTTVHTEKGSTSLLTLDKVKNLESFSGVLSDRTSIDEDSDTDRLVIDLEEISPKKQSKIEKKEESRQKSGSKCDTVVEKIRKEMDKIQNSVPNCSPDSKNKIESTTGQDKVYRESAESETQKDKSVSFDSKRLSKEGVVESLSTKCRRESKESESSTLSKTSVERNQCFESTNTVKPKVSGEFTRSKVSANTTQTEEPKGMSKCKTQSKQSGDTSHCKESTGKIMLKESADMTKSNEDMEVVVDDDDDDMEVLDDLSTLPLDSDLPVNTNSSLPDKNFVKPPITDVSEHVPTGSKVAEKFSQKLLKTIQETMDEMYTEVMKEKNDGKTIEMLNKTLSQAKWDYCQELNELKHNFQLTMFEMKAGWESEKEQIVKALNAKHQAEKELAIKETKKKQWCAQCGKEAIFYCCWNTSYCDYPCQQSHWPQHMHTCLQTNKDKTTSTTTSASQGSQSQTVSQSASSTPSSVGPSVTSQSSGSITTPTPEPDHLRQLQDNISRAIHREEEKRGESRPGVSPKFSSPMSSPVMQNIRQPGSGQMMFNMQPSAQPGVMQQLQRTRFMGQQMAMQVQQRASLPQSQQGNPRMLFSQPLIQHAVYPLQVQQPQPIGGTILFQNAQQMSYGMPPRPY